MVNPKDESAKTILVVEDDEIEREGTAVVLRQAGYSVATAANGQEALDYLKTGPLPDLILLAMLMPVMDGWRFLDERKRNPAWRTIPVIIRTGTILSREWAEMHGCAGFLRKPVAAADLLREVARCLGSGK